MNSFDHHLMKRLFAFLLAWTFATVARAGAGADWQSALPGSIYHFPADHYLHPDFKTEWWYFTGTLKTDAGKEYGYELTFFRQGMLPPALQKLRSALAPEARSRFVQNDFKFAHFAISDLTGRRFHFTQKISRGAYGDAGFGSSPPDTPGAAAERIARIDDWTLAPQADGTWKITAEAQEPVPMAVDLVVPTNEGTRNRGRNGRQPKGAGERQRLLLLFLHPAPDDRHADARHGE